MTENARTCGDCNLCCIFPSIGINKDQEKVKMKDGTPYGQKKPYERCKHLSKDKSGCSVYENRPNFCASFKCGWLVDENISDRLSPHNTGMIFTIIQNKNTKERSITLYEGRENAWSENADKFEHAIVNLLFMGFAVGVVEYKTGQIISSFGLDNAFTDI